MNFRLKFCIENLYMWNKPLQRKQPGSETLRKNDYINAFTSYRTNHQVEEWT